MKRCAYYALLIFMLLSWLCIKFCKKLIFSYSLNYMINKILFKKFIPLQMKPLRIIKINFYLTPLNFPCLFNLAESQFDHPRHISTCDQLRPAQSSIPNTQMPHGIISLVYHLPPIHLQCDTCHIYIGSYLHHWAKSTCFHPRICSKKYHFISPLLRVDIP